MRAIDADELRKAIANSGLIWETTECLDVIELLSVKKIIDNAPTVEERPKGKWIAIHKGYVCSNCNKYTITINDKHYCFKCGADMRGDV